MPGSWRLPFRVGFTPGHSPLPAPCRTSITRRHYLARSVLLAGVLACGVAQAEGETTLALDAERSSAEFEVKVLWLIGVHGRFGRVQGEIRVDAQRVLATADARIEVGAITMRNRSYEEWLKSPEFFDASAHPDILFASRPFALNNLRQGGEIAGLLTVRGIERPIVLQVTPSTCPEALAVNCPVQASGSIRRSEFGMRTRRASVSDKVDLAFTIYLAAAPGAPVESH
jgi:polyisoprenoid-binding protein YceI